MKKAPIPEFEKERICAVKGLHLLDTATEERFDLITKEAIVRFNVPISTITLVDEDREWFKSVQGLPQKEDPRETSFCGHAIMSESMMVVEDTTTDSRFFDNPIVKGTPFIRFYAGKSLYDRKSKMPVGVFCIKGLEPKVMNAEDINDFLELALRAEDEVNKRV